MHPSSSVSLGVLVALVGSVAACRSTNSTESNPPSAPANATLGPPENQHGCAGPSVVNHLGRFEQDAAATVDHLLSSFMGQSPMTAKDIEDHVGSGAVTIQVAVASIVVDDARCCVEEVLADTEQESIVDVQCPRPGGKKRVTLRKRPDGKTLVIFDLTPDEPHDPEAIGWNPIRYEEFVLAPVGSR
jgi:hypothetical protein